MVKINNIKELDELISKKQVFLFDFDGVVAHTERLQWEAYNVILKRYNVEIPKDIWISYIGTSEKEIWAMIKRDFDIEVDIDLVMKERFNIYLNLVKEKDLQPFPVFIEILKNYPNKKYYILTSNTENVVKDMLINWNLFEKFEEIISVSTRGISKKEVLMDTNKNLNCSSNEILYFEDMNKNLKMAQELNITTIGIEHEFNKNKLINCDFLIDGNLN